MRRPITLVHTADVHLGASFPYLGSKGSGHRRRVEEAFSRVVGEALSRHVDLFVVAGDLFHSNSPGRRTVDFATQALRRLVDSGIVVAVVPGTHDHDGPDSVWRLESFQERVPGIHLLLGEGLAESKFPDLGLTLLTRPNTTNSSPESPMQGLTAHGRGGVVIGIAHGSVALGDKIGQKDFPIAPHEISSSGLHYLALGHWHRSAEYSRDGVTAWYSGSPEVLYPKDTGGGQFLLVTVSEDGARVEPITVGHCKAESITLSVEEYPEPLALEEAIRRRSDPDLMLDVKLTGLKPLDCSLMTEVLEEIESALASGCYFLRVRDETHPRFDAEVLERHHEVTVAGRFLKLLSEAHQDAASEEERRVVEEAIHLGLALLGGREGVLT